jgi:hypothetical protein
MHQVKTQENHQEMEEEMHQQDQVKHLHHQVKRNKFKIE